MRCREQRSGCGYFAETGTIALLSEEGSEIAKRISRGVVPEAATLKVRCFETIPALRATPPDSEGEFFRKGKLW